MKNISSVFVYIKLLRPKQWLKNLMIYFPSFLSGEILSLFKPSALLPFAAFCLASSASYIINDCKDLAHDLHHPDKKKRPIASGQISIRSGYYTVVLLLFAASIFSYSVSIEFCKYLCLYLLTSLTYTFYLKNIVLLDILGITTGFLIRLAAGGIAFAITVSNWLFLCVFLLSLFLSAGKRLSEKKHLGSESPNHRKVLAGYSSRLLESIMVLSGCSVLLTYILYIIPMHSMLMLFTVPVCVFGLFRYYFRLRKGNSSGDPTESLTRDIPLFITGLLWTAMVGWGVYGR